MADPPDPGTYHPDVLEFYQYWDSKRRGRLMPSRADIDPIEMPRFLPGIVLIDVVADARRYVYRLVGTREVAMRGKDPTGRSMIEGFFGPSLEETIAMPDRVVTARAPLFFQRKFIAPDRRSGDEEVVLLPLSADGETVSMILAYTHHRLA
jgi:hypothetical protein